MSNFTSGKSSVILSAWLSPCVLGIVLIGLAGYLLYQAPQPNTLRNSSNKIASPFANHAAPAYDYRQALDQIHAHRYAEAMALLKKVVESPAAARVSNPVGDGNLSDLARYKTAFCLKAMGKDKEAVRMFDSMLKQNLSPEQRRRYYGYREQFLQADASR